MQNSVSANKGHESREKQPLPTGLWHPENLRWQSRACFNPEASLYSLGAPGFHLLHPGLGIKAVALGEGRWTRGQEAEGPNRVEEVLVTAGQASPACSAIQEPGS